MDSAESAPRGKVMIGWKMEMCFVDEVGIREKRGWVRADAWKFCLKAVGLQEREFPGAWRMESGKERCGPGLP